jgi:4-carboxymuconolactone decarboxylase
MDHAQGTPPMPDLFDRGMTTRRAVLGNAHVDRAMAATTDFDAPFQTLITEGAWGRVWADDTISRRERSMLTLALLAATGNFEEIPMHIRATANTGASKDDIMQAFLHVAIYAGVPKANHAIKLARQTLAEMEEAAK